MRVLATIHARAGSVRYPRKNLADFRGMPIMCHSLAKALQAPQVTDVAFSSDCSRMKAIAASFSDRVVVLDRPAELATESEGLTVRRHVVFNTIKQWRQVTGCEDQIASMFLQPLILSDDIVDRCAEAMVEAGKGTVEPVEPVVDHPNLMFRLNENGYLYEYACKMKDLPISQEFEKLWISTCGVMGFMDPWVEGPAIPVKCERHEVVDIHTKLDHYIADAMAKFRDEQIAAAAPTPKART
jgi:CMP-N-acetylneuraminic acid synthetase